MNDVSFDLATATQGQVVEKLKSVEAELKGLAAKGDNATEADLDHADVLADLCNGLKEKSANFAARFKKIGSTAADLHDHLHKPVNGMVHGNGAESKSTSTNDKGVEFNKEVSGVQAKSAPWAIFGDAGGFFNAVKGWSNPSPERDSVEKISAWKEMQVKTTPAGLYEGSDPDGGILVPGETSANIYSRALELENLWTRIDSIPVKGNTMSFPKLNDKSRADGSRDGGVLGYWEGEGDTFTASKPGYGLDTLRLKKLAVLVYATDELLNDSPFTLQTYITERAAAEIAFKLNFGLVRGTGSGMPLGILNSGCLISVPKETNQAAASLVTKNIDKMWMRLWAPYRSDAIWIINQDVEEQFQSMALPIGTAGVPTYLPAGGLSATPYAQLKGRPVVIVEQCSTLGTVGDIILANFKQIRGIQKGGIDSAMSMHVRFLTAEQTFRFLFRADAQNKWGEPITPYQGNTTYSPVVALATRS